MKRVVFTVAFLLLLSVSGNAALAQESENVYKSATEYDYPPFSVTSNGEPDGFSVELLRQVAEVMDLELSFKIDSWSVLKEELKNGELDVLPLVGYTEDRDIYYDFTVPYIIMHGNIFIRKDNKQISTEQDLYDKQIVVMKGDNAHEYALRMGFSENLILTDTYQEAFELLESGKYDAVLAQSLVGEQLIEHLGLRNVKAATQIDEDGLTHIRTNLVGFEQKFCFAVLEGDKTLLSKLNEGLAIVSTNGTFDELYKKWFPFLIDDSISFLEKLKSSAFILMPILLLVLIASNLFVRHKIKLKSGELERANKSLLDMEAHIRERQKFEAIGTLASGVAHEINNPINGVMNYGQLILDLAVKRENSLDDARPVILEYSSEIINESNRISAIVQRLLSFSRKERAFEKTKVGDLIDGTLRLIKTIFGKDQILLNVDVSDGLPPIECRSQELQQVLMNLLINASQALNSQYEGFDENKKICISAASRAVNGKKGVRITIEDRGTGIPEEIKDKIFNPFFTTKNRTEGTGLGLSISYRIVNEHNGILSFESEDGEYTRFYIDLPLRHTV